MLVSLSGCATVPADLGRSDVDALAAERGLALPKAQTDQLDELLAEPLTADSAVQIALMNNPGLRSELASLGFGAAEVYAAGRLSNPRFSGAWLDSKQSGEGTQRTLGLALPFADLLTLPVRAKLAQLEFAILKSDVANAAMIVATDTEVAFYQLIADQRVQEMRVRQATAATLAADLAMRFHTAGNINDKELAELRAGAAEAQLDRLDGDAQVNASRSRLAGSLGLSTADPWQVDTALAQPPAEEAPLSEVAALAQQQRLDLLAARTKADVLAQRLGFTSWSRWLGDLELGFEREREADGARLSGPSLDLEIPLFNQHRDDVLVADASLAQAAANLAALTLDVENGVQLAYAGVENARARVAAYEQMLIPARTEIVARTQEEVNFMLAGIFELLGVKREELAGYEGYLQSVGDYWIARAHLAQAVGVRLPVQPGPTIDIEPSESPGHEHHQHQHHGDHQ